jgi:hypothetical protein
MITFQGDQLLLFFPFYLFYEEISVADPGCLSRILIFTHPGSQIPDPKTATKERGEKIFYVIPVFM